MPRKKTSKKKKSSSANSTLSFRQRLARLNFKRGSRMLGTNGNELINQGGQWEFDIDADVTLSAAALSLRLRGTTATIVPDENAAGQLRATCSTCDEKCQHMGAAVSLVLEEKVALGLAALPDERTPIENLTEHQLVERALADRLERAQKERMRVQSADPSELWADYHVTSEASGKTYRVALRGWEPGESYCSCPDFRKNTLGVCKHILNVQRKVKSRFPANVRKNKFRRHDVSIHLQYGRDLELRVALPEQVDRSVSALVRPIRDKAITNVRDLLGRVRKLSARGYDVNIYPDAEELLNHRLFQEHIGTLVNEIRDDPAAHPLRQSLLKTELLPYQLDGVAFAAGAGRAILADDMGLGKTIQGIGVAELLAREANINHVLVICPTSLKTQWQSEIARFSDRDSQLIMGNAAERAAQYDNDRFFTICNYEQVLRDYHAIERSAWDMIILDEGQRIKNWEAKTSRMVKALKSRFALVLTGTPLENRLDDLYSIIEFIDDRRLGPAFRFHNRHRVVDERGKVLGYKNLDDLREKLKPILLRRTRDSVMKQLPKRTTQIVRIEPTEDQLDHHRIHMQTVSRIVSKPYLTEMDLLRLQKALLMCRLAANATFLVDKQAPGTSSKLDKLTELLGELSHQDGRKTIIFSEWTRMLDLIEPLLNTCSASFVRLDGSVPQKKRQALVDRFQNDKDCKFFLTSNAGSTGLNLQSANTVINVDLPWNPAVLEQRIARAHRMGQKQPVHVYVLVTQNTIEENLLGTLSAKHELALAALDPDSEADQVEMTSGMEELKRRLEILLGSGTQSATDTQQASTISPQRAKEQAARKQQVAAAGGELLGAAFHFLSQIAPAGQTNEDTTKVAETIHARLAECMETDDTGRRHLTVTLPDDDALAKLAGSLAQLLSLGEPNDG